MPVSVIDSITKKLFGHKAQQAAVITNDVRSLVIATIDAERGIDKKPVFDLDDGASILNEADWTEQDFRAACKVYSTRIDKAKPAGEVADRQKRATELEQARIAFDIEEGNRRRAAMEKLADMELQEYAARTAADAAVEAEDFMHHTAAEPVDEQALIDENAKLCASIKKKEIALNPGKGLTAGLSASIVTHPAAYLAQLEDELRFLQKQAQKNPEGELLLRTKVENAKQAVAKAKAELANLQKQRDAVLQKMRTASADFLDPKNFKLVRVRETRDDKAKKLAATLAYGRMNDGN